MTPLCFECTDRGVLEGDPTRPLRVGESCSNCGKPETKD